MFVARDAELYTGASRAPALHHALTAVPECAQGPDV